MPDVVQAIPQQAPLVRLPVGQIALFYVAAVLVSLAAAQLPGTGNIQGFAADKWLLVGLGPLVATGLTCLVFRTKFPSLLGHQRLFGIAALVVPILAVAFAGFASLAKPGLAGLIFGASIVLYCLCEEAGWRGFLTGALSTLKDWQADILTGVLWFAWHFTFMPELYDPDYVGGFILAILAGAFGLAETRRRTGGFALAAGWHAAVKLTPLGALAIPVFVVMAGLTWASKPNPPSA